MEDKDNVITLTDEEGNEVDFVVVNAIEYNGNTYVMLVEASRVDDDEAEALLLRVVEDGDEDVLVTVDDEDEFNAVAAAFDKAWDDYELHTDAPHGDGCGCGCCGNNE